MSESNISLEDLCESYALIVVHPFYRSMQGAHIILSFASLILLTYGLIYTWKQFPFHYNIKVLFMSLFCACLIHSLWVAAFQIHHLILSFTFTKPCDLILNPILYGFFHVPLVWCVIWIELTMVLMFIERTMATVNYQCYETTTHKTGNILLAISVIAPIFLNALNYVGKDFAQPQISALNTPKTNNITTNAFMGFVTGVNLVGVIASVALYVFNTKRKIPENHSLPLTARYQASENAIASKFLTAITIGQLIIFLIYGAATIYLRMGVTDEAKADVDVYYRSHIMMVYTVPFYTFALPIICMLCTHWMQRTRSRSITSMVQVRSTGEDGWQNYAAQMAWN